MDSTIQSAERSLARVVYRICRLSLGCAVIALCGMVVFQAFALEAFHIPTGSMAPALFGHHRICICPRCEQEVAVGRHADDSKGTGESRFYRKAFCPNCGHSPLPVQTNPEVPGDQINVDKSAYLRRTPSRWEIIVFRLLGNLYIKRLLGLPGEAIAIRDGDIYIDGSLCRKRLQEARRMRVLVFDQEKPPKDTGWQDRWENQPAGSAPSPGSTKLTLRAGATITYQNILLDEHKCEPLRDEYAYNAGVHACAECVHDFMVETNLMVRSGQGSIALRLCDGHDWIEVLLPVGATRPIEAFAWPVGAPAKMRKLGDGAAQKALQVGECRRLELAFVDRRVSLAIDGKLWLSLDLPATGKRGGVTRPFAASSDGVHAQLLGFRLFRDVHYGQQGRNAVRGKSVRLDKDQYFMLGDNSANSEDSRYWPDRGRVKTNDLIGPITSWRRSPSAMPNER